jgi:hypothetical protein
MSKRYRFSKHSEHWLIAFVACFFLVPLLYFIRFADQGFGPQETWGQFGDYLGGTLNPFIGLFTVWGLLMAFKLQSAQLAVARKDSVRQAKDMRDAAQLNALTAALEATNIMIEKPCHTGERAIPDAHFAVARREAIIREILANLNMDPTMYMPKWATESTDSEQK